MQSSYDKNLTHVCHFRLGWCRLFGKNATVRSGTSRKSFKGYRNDRILSKLNMGGKTGSIFNKKTKILVTKKNKNT